MVLWPQGKRVRVGLIGSTACCSIAQSCPTLCDPMEGSVLGSSVHHWLLKLAQTHVHRVCDALQPSHPLLSPSPPVFNLSQHQGLFQWISSLHQVAKVLELQHHIYPVKVKVAQLCPTLRDLMDYMVHGILQARVLKWVTFHFSRGSSQPRDWTQISSIPGWFFTSWATKEAQEYWSG